MAKTQAQTPPRDEPVDAFAPTSQGEADLLSRFPIAKPSNPHRKFVMRNGRLHEIVPDSAAEAIEVYLAGRDVDLVDGSPDVNAPS